MSKSNKKSKNEEPPRDDESLVVDETTARDPKEGEKLKEAKQKIEQKVEELLVQLENDQKRLLSLGEELSKNFTSDFDRLLGEVQTLSLNLGDLKMDNEISKINIEITDFKNQLNDLQSRVKELGNRISESEGEQEPAHTKDEAEITIPEPAEATAETEKAENIAVIKETPPEILPEDKLRKLVDLLERTDNDDMQRWAESLKVGLPEEADESYSLKGKRKIVSTDKTFLPEILAKVKKAIEFTVAGRSADRVAAIKQAAGEGENKDVYLEMASLLGIKEKNANLSETAKNELQALRQESDELYGNAVNFVRTIEKEKKENPELYSNYIENAYIVLGTIESLSKSLDRIDTDEKFGKVKQATEEKIVSHRKEFLELKNNYDRRVIPGEKEEGPELKKLSQEKKDKIPESVSLLKKYHGIERHLIALASQVTEDAPATEKEIQIAEGLLKSYSDAWSDYSNNEIQKLQKGIARGTNVAHYEKRSEQLSRALERFNKNRLFFEQFWKEQREKLSGFGTSTGSENLHGGEEESEAGQVISELLSAEAERVARETEAAEPVEEVAADIITAEAENTEAIRAENERIEELTQKLIEARTKLTEAFIAKEKASGVVGRFKKMFRKGEAKGAEDEAFEAAWNEYADLQKEVVEATRAQAEHLRNFLGDQSKLLQEKIGAYYKGKENVVAKVWKRLGDMNLYNFLEKKGAEVKKKEAEDKLVGTWDRFWANRAKELQGSNRLYKLGAKALSVRLGLSLGLMSAGVFGITGAAEARGAMVGIGTAFGSRHMEDALQNKLQRRFGNRGDFYGSSEEAERVLKDKYFLASTASGETEEDADDKKAEKRRKKMEKELGLAEKSLLDFESLPLEQRMAKIQEKIASVEAFSYVNGVDISQDANYNRLVAARNKITEEYLAVKAIEAGDERSVIRPDNIADAMAFLESRKAELSRTAEKISTEKLTRWGKRLIAAAAGVASGTYAYFATLRRADLYAGHEPTGAAAVQEAVPQEAGTPQAEAPFPEGVEQTEPGIVMEQEYVSGMTPEELAKLNNFFETAGDNQQATQEFQQYINAGHSAENITNAFLVHKGDGIERVLQRQLFLNPEAHGFKGDLNNFDEVRKWAGHEASVIAQKQGLADKYFIYDAKNPQYLVLNEDNSVDILGQGKLHHVSEIAAAKARQAAEEAADMAKTPEGEAVPVREVIDMKTGQPDIFTDVEQAEYQILVNKGEYDDAMDLMMRCKERGPVYEMPDGTEIHRADIGAWEGDAPKIIVPSGSTIDISYYGPLQRSFAGVRPAPEFIDSTKIGWSEESHRYAEIQAGKSDFQPGTPEYKQLESNWYARHQTMLGTESEINDLKSALTQTHPDSDERNAIVSALKFQFNTLDRVNIPGHQAAEVYGKDFVSQIRNTPTIKTETSHILPSQPLETTEQPISYEQAYEKPLKETEATAEDIFERADREMEEVNKGFDRFYAKDTPLNTRLDSLRQALNPGETTEYNSVKYSLRGNQVVYELGNIRGTLDSAKEADLLSDINKLVTDKSQEMYYDEDGPASQELKGLIEELAKENKKVI